MNVHGNSSPRLAPSAHRAIDSRRIRSLHLLIGLALLFAVSGASCPRRLTPPGDLSPAVFTQQPTAAEIIAAINANGNQVQQLQAHGAKLNVPGAPALKTSLALERPLRFRLRAGLGLTGTELDIGSNDEIFWLWAKRNSPNGIYFARHADFSHSAANQILPIPPAWLIETMGLVQIDPTSQIDGPYIRGAGRLEVRAVVQSPNGVLTKVFVVDQRSGVLLEQHVYDAAGQLLASAIQSNHTYDASFNVTLPRRIDIQLPPAQMAFSLTVDNFTINSPFGDSSQLFSAPQLPGAQMVPLAFAPLPAAGETQVAIQQSGPGRGSRIAGWQSGSDFMARTR